jgi:DNA-binding transcriptional LysR family regulator
MVTSGSTVFPHVIHSFVKDHKVADLEMMVRPRDQLLALLHNEQIDLALMVREPDVPHFAAQQFGNHPFVLVASSTHPLAETSAIPLERILGECLIVRERGTDTRGVTDDAFHDYVPLMRSMELGCAEAVKQSVIAGIGVTLISSLEVQSELRAGTLAVLDVQGFPLARHWHVVHRVDRPLPSVAQDFRQFLLTDAPAWLAHGAKIAPSATPPAADRRRSPIMRPAIATAVPH